MATQNIFTLSELDSSKVAQAGGKGASLGELIVAGAPVPPGFVVASSAFSDAIGLGQHLQYLQEVLQRVGGGQIAPGEASQEIADHLRAVRVPDDLAAAIAQALDSLGVSRVSVRSSATCEDGGSTAWAGQLETYLDVPPERVVDRVRDCWMSMFSPPALAYGAAHGYGAGQFAVAVVVQQMVASEISGIGFSVHPVTQEPDVMLVEACLGLGEAIVSGRIVPDQYIVQRGSNAILESVVGQQREGLFMDHQKSEAQWSALDERGGRRKLTDDQVVEYAELLSRIHDHYGHPVDTEWAIQDGQFQVMQARPITTLAEEYQEPLIDPSVEWVRLIRRPLSLVEASIITHWVDARHAERTLGLHIDRMMSIQDEDGMAHLIFEGPALEACFDGVAKMIREDRPRLIEILEYGRSLHRNAHERIDRGEHGFRDIEEAVDFFADCAQHTTVFPFWVLSVSEREGIDDPEVRALAEELRSRTLYPAIERQIIDPMVTDITRGMGFSSPEEARHLVTWTELRDETLDCDKLESRLNAVRNGHRFVFHTIDGEDEVQFVSQSGYLLMRLAKQRQIVQESNDDQLFGQAAWPGVYQGRARVVLSPDVVGQTFEQGEVLVSIQSSPALMPFLERCGAIVTDDGGIACHAAIIARELRKPTLIGTGKATSTIRTGDLVEVDTFAQTVRIIERSVAS